MSIENDILRAKMEITSKIGQLQSDLELIDNIDWSSPVTKEQWRKICNTDLRGRECLKVLVKNTFPEAENISLCHNYAFFAIRGIEVCLSTLGSVGINLGANPPKPKHERTYIRELLSAKIERTHTIAEHVWPVLSAFAPEISFYRDRKFVTFHDLFLEDILEAGYADELKEIESFLKTFDFTEFEPTDTEGRNYEGVVLYKGCEYKVELHFNSKPHAKQAALQILKQQILSSSECKQKPEQEPER